MVACHVEQIPQPPALRWVADKQCTPGVTFKGVTVKNICTPGWARAHRSVSTAKKRQVYARYNVPYVYGKYEVDHLIPLELGGNNSLANLWPELKGDGSPGDALDKDQTENALHAGVCAGRITLSSAWAIMRTWTR